jgi:protein-S-isoprenylcysteine O-methyltransferase Ste14
MKTQQLLAFIFPITGLLIIPALLLFYYQTLSFYRQISAAFILPGAALFLVGLYLLVETSWAISKIGEGSIMPWYPAQNLVISGSYAYARNPMIGGALLVLAGEALLFDSGAILVYMFIFFIINDIYFNLVEEPALEKKFADRYREYKKNVPKWLPRRKPWRQQKDQ